MPGHDLQADNPNPIRKDSSEPIVKKLFKGDIISVEPAGKQKSISPNK